MREFFNIFRYCYFVTMNISILRLLLSLSLLINLGNSLIFASVETEWMNPIVPQRADPHIYLHTDGYYYLAATVPEYDRIEIRRARLLGELSTATPKIIWYKHDKGIMGAHIWAPEIHFINDKWYVYFSAGESDAIWEIRLYALSNNSKNPLEGEWEEMGKIKTHWESFTLDATTFACDGIRYLVWTQSVPDEKGTNIYIAEMNSPISISGTQVELTRPEYQWERVGHWVNEAPAVLVKNGRVFMTYSASATGSEYCMGLLTAELGTDLLDPKSWVKSSKPVLTSDAETGQYGPGHNSFTTTLDGKTDILVYHTRSYAEIVGNPLRNPDRATRAQVLHWFSDGTPDFGIPVPDGSYSE